jgi:hypothetical protein
MDKLLISLLSIICILVILNIAKNIYPNSIEFFQSGEGNDDDDDGDDDDGDDGDDEVGDDDDDDDEVGDDEITEEELVTTLFPATTVQPKNECSELETDTSYKGLTKFIFNESDPCQKQIYEYMGIFNEDNLSKNYTLSFLFKSDNDNNENRLQYLLHIKNQLSFYIKNNILFVNDSKNVERLTISLKTVEMPENSNTNTLNLIEEEIKDEHRLSFNHFAIVCKLNAENEQLEYNIFVNGVKGKIMLNISSGFKYTDIEIGKHTLSDANYYFIGSILDPKFENKVISETTLCSRWNSCGINECSYKENLDPTDTRQNCYDNCLMSSDCSEKACNNKCFNRNLSLWSPKCNFSAQGETKEDCIKQCLKFGKCRYDICSSKCNSCTDIYKCPWIKGTDQAKGYYNKDKLFDPKLLKCKKCIPPVLNIEVKKNRTITIKWSQPLKLDLNSYEYTDKLDEEIDMFVFILSKTTKLNEGSELFTYKVSDIFRDKIKSFNKNIINEQLIHEFEIKNLDENEEYNILCKSIKLHKGKCDDSDSETTKSPAEGQSHTISDSSYTYKIIPEVKYKYSSI